MKRTNVTLCRNLRRNQTDAEKKLWSIVRKHQIMGVKFKRQFAIAGYIIDFYAAKYKLGIEVDGGQHYEAKGGQLDTLRTNRLSKIGIKLLRFNNLDVLKNIEGVYDAIESYIKIREM